jgi:hypothetical protein
VGFEVNVEPFAPRSLCLLRRESHRHRSYAFSLVLTMGLCVDEECVVSTVPHDVHEPDQPSVFGARRYPTEAAGTDSVPPSGLRISSMCDNEFNHLLIG